MEAILFIGIQASGKSTFYKMNFFNSHLRISNDLLKTKNREKLLLEYCINTQMPCVIDNTNLTKEVRLKYLERFKQAQYKVTGYYFRTDIKQSLQWNKNRKGKEYIPEVGILGAYKKIEIPSYEEGFNKLFYVNVIDREFQIKEWEDEI